MMYFLTACTAVEIVWVYMDSGCVTTLNPCMLDVVKIALATAQRE